MFVEERHQHSKHQHRHHRHRERNRKDQKEVEITKTADEDPVYPEARLEVILKGLEERVQGGREKLFKLQYQRSDLEFELKGLQEEKVVLDGSLAEAKQGEALVREKERQITAEFKEITDGRQKSTTTTPSKADGLIKRTLILGRELFSLLLRDIAIEETARNAFECRVTRIQNELIKKAAERNQLQEKVILLQTDCEVDLEQKRHIYDEVHLLQKRSESFDAQISMLTEWRKSLQNQITSVNVAIEKRRNTVLDPIATSPLTKESDDEKGILPFHQKQLPPPSCQASIEYSLASESPPPSPQHSSYDSELQLLPSVYQPSPSQQQTQRTESEQFGNSIQPRQLQLKPYSNLPVIPSQDFGAFSPASTKLELVAQFKQQDGDELESRTFDDSPESFTSDDSLVTMRTSRSVLFNLSSSTTRSASDADYDDEEKDEAENETNHSTSSDTSESPPPFDYVLSQLHDVQAMKIPTETSSTTSKTPFGFEIWREILPSEVTAAPSLSKKNSKYEEKDGDEDDEMDDDEKK